MKLKLFSLLLAALLLVACGSEAPAPQSPATSPETTAAADTATTVPDFTVYDGNSQPVKLSDFFGKPIVLNFWASWCGPCKSEMPAFQSAFEKYGDQVQFVMVNVGEHMDEGSAFITSAGYTFPVYYDVNNDASYTYQISSIPASFFLNAKGELVTYHIGTMDESVLLAAIEAIQ